MGVTALELAVIEGLAGGLHSKEIAKSVNRSVARVESVVQTLYAKLDARSRAHIVSLAYCHGLLPRRLQSRELRSVSAFARRHDGVSVDFDA